MELPDTALEWDNAPPELLALLQQLVQENQQLQARIEHLESANAKLAKMVFGPRTERRPLPPANDLQSWLFEQAREELQQKVESRLQESQPVAEHQRRKPRRRKELPEHLPREKTVCELPADQRRCACGSTMEPMGTEVRPVLEHLSYTYVHEIHRTKYCCRGCQSGVLVAPAPTAVIDKGILGNSFVAHALVDRFQFHMPYHRQEKKYLSEGVQVSRSVLCETTARCAELLDPVFDALKDQILSSSYLKADETTSVLQSSSEGDKRTAYFWAYLEPKEGVIFDFTESRSRDGPGEMLAGFEGYLQVDGFSGYNQISDRPGVTRVGCWAHVRRKFDEAQRSDPQFAEEALRQIDQLYVHDRVSRSWASDERKEHRAVLSQWVEDFHDWLQLRQTQVLEQGELGKAIRYTLGQWPELIRFLEDGRLEIGGVDRWRGGVRLPVAVPALSSTTPQSGLPWLRFERPLIEPDVRISRIRLSSRASHLRTRRAA